MAINIDTLIVSDIHLGLPSSRPDGLLNELKKYSMNTLILNGDVFDHMTQDVNLYHWKLLSYIQKISSGTEVLWCKGNHDELIAPQLAPVMGAMCVEDYQWSFQGIKFIAIHGHQFDDFIQNNPSATTGWADKIYVWLQKHKAQELAVDLKDVSKIFLRTHTKVAAGAIKYAKSKGADFAICGHTHMYMNSASDDGSIQYVNENCACQAQSGYITIDSNGFLEYHEF